MQTGAAIRRVLRNRYWNTAKPKSLSCNSRGGVVTDACGSETLDSEKCKCKSGSEGLTIAHAWVHHFIK